MDLETASSKPRTTKLLPGNLRFGVVLGAIVIVFAFVLFQTAEGEHAKKEYSQGKNLFAIGDLVDDQYLLGNTDGTDSVLALVGGFEIANNVITNETVDVTITTPTCTANEWLAEYYDNKDLQGSPILTQCESVIDHDWGDQGPTSSNSTITGPDLIVVAGEIAYTDDVRSAVASTTTLGGNSVTVVDASGFQVGDEVLVIQMGGIGVGQYEYAKITGISGTTLSLSGVLQYKYSVGDNSKAQVVKVPHYNNVSISGTLTAHAWDSGTGGIVAFRANNVNLLSGGVIDVTALGYKGGRGGYLNHGSIPHTGSTGGSYISTDPLQGPVASGDCGGCVSPPGPANGGGGFGGQGSRGHDFGAGGGGGSYNTLGGTGEGDTQWPYAPGGAPGSAYGNADLSQIYFGSGGGGGGKGKDGWGQEGGAGGGIVMVYATNIQIEGIIRSNGQNGYSGGQGNSGGGGGGAGGSILLQGETVAVNNNLFVAGGMGSFGWNHGWNRYLGRGGGGGAGRIRVEYCEALTGSSPGVSFENIGCGDDNFSVRWTGTFDLNPNIYRFNTWFDDGMKVWVDDSLIIDKWEDGYHEESAEQYVPSTSTIKVEYYENTGNAQAKLNIVPATNQPPIIEPIPDQIVAVGQQFQPLDLDLYGYDPDSNYAVWDYSGNTDLQISIDESNILTVTKPGGWAGEELITLTLTDEWNESTSANVVFGTFECEANQYLAEYFDNDTLSGDPSYTQCEDVIDYDWGESGPITEANIIDFGDGSDGPITISGTVVDVPIDSSAIGTAGTYTLSATNAGFIAGQKVLIHQTRGVNSGTYQFNEIASYADGTITLVDPLNSDYVTDLPHDEGISYRTDTDKPNKAQVLVLKQYSDVTVEPGARWIPKTWRGRTGGILAFYANGNVVVDGVIDVGGGYGDSNVADGAGHFEGYRRNSNVTGAPGGSGEGSGGFGNVRTRSANGTGGGGGLGDATGGGGGGGGNYTPGSNGDGTGGGEPGGTCSTDTQLCFGGAGGGGGKSTVYNTVTFSGNGANGAGILILMGDNLIVNGSIDADGGTGSTPRPDAYVGAGGGSAGGAVLLKVGSADLGTNKVSALGGAGGVGPNGGGNGGTGGIGYIRVEYCDSLTGTTLSTSVSTKLDCPVLGDNFSIRWTGYFDFNTGEYNFQSISDDGMRVSIDDAQIINSWQDGYTDINIDETLTSGVHKIEAEYYENTGNARVYLNWEQYLVKLYDEMDYGGNILNEFGTGFTNDPSTTAESVYIPNGWSVTVWSGDDQTGEEQCWNTSIANLQEYGWSSVIESVEVSNTDVCNQPPLVTDIPDQTVDEDQPFVTFDLDDYGSDPNADDTLVWTFEGNIDLTVEIDIENIVTITVPENWNGTEEVVFTVTDSYGEFASDSAVFTVNPVNDAPEITSTPITTVDEDTLYEYDVDATDIDSTDLTYSLLQSPTGISIDSATGMISWTPGNDDVGDHTVEVEVSDGELTDTQQFTLTVNNVNDTPVLSAIPEQTTDEDTAFATFDLDDYASDIDAGDILTYSWTDNVNLSVNIDGDNVVSVVPTADWNGQETITFTVIDLAGATASQDVLFTVNPVNDAPTAPSNPIPADGAEDQDRNITLGWDVSTDVDGDAIVYDVYIGERADSLVLVGTDVAINSFDVTLNYNTEYFWQVVANDGNGGETAGPVWSFTTLAEFSSTGFAIVGESNGTVNKNVDPGETVEFAIYLNNNTDTEVKKLDVYVSTDSPYVTMKTDHRSIKKIPAGTEGRIGDFRFQVDPSTPIGEVLTFTIEYKYLTEGITVVETYEFIVMDPDTPPTVISDEISLNAFAIGNLGDNTVINPSTPSGADVMQLEILSDSIDSQKVQLYLFTENQYIEITDNYAEVLNLTAGVPEWSNNLGFTIDPSIPVGSSVEFKVHAVWKDSVTGAFEDISVLEFEVPVE